jgi:hypothetical protein
MQKSDKEKIQSLNESISKLETQITLFKAEGNTRALKTAETILKFFQLKIKELKSK